MKSINRFLAALVLSVLPLTVFAQVTNGDFSSGTASWNWKQDQMVQVPYDSCLNHLATFTPNTSNDTPTDPFQPSRGRFAVTTAPGQLFNGTYDLCRSIDQTVFVPSATSLSFEAKLGTALSGTYNGGSAFTVEFFVSAVNVSTGVETPLLYATGQSYKCPIQSTCPQWTPYNVSLSSFWGQNIVLKFRTRTQQTRSGTGQISAIESQAFLDNVVIQ
jgi:hypothetical protein